MNSYTSGGVPLLTIGKEGARKIMGPSVGPFPGG
jgi:hypothetical protein